MYTQNPPARFKSYKSMKFRNYRKSETATGKYLMRHITKR